MTNNRVKEVLVWMEDAEAKLFRGFRCYKRRQNTTGIAESQKQKYSAGYQDFQVEIRLGGGLSDTAASVSLRTVSAALCAALCSLDGLR